MLTGKVQNVDTSNGTNLRAFAAIDAFFKIYCRKLIYNVDSVVFTAFFAFFTADAGICAFSSGDRAFIVVVTEHDSASDIGDKSNKMLGAGGGTHTATDAAVGRDPCHAVLYTYCVIGASGNAVAVSETAVGTFTRSAV